MPSLGDAYPGFLDALETRYGRPPLPAEEAGFEALARAYLEHQLGQSRAEVVLDQFRDAGALDSQTLAALDPAELPTILEDPKAAPRWAVVLRRLAIWYEAARETARLDEVSTDTLRDSLRDVNGLGPGSVDVVLLRGLNRASMPVERAWVRVLIRHGWIDTSQTYDEIRQTLESLAPEDPGSLSALATGLERVAKEFCKPAGPRCEPCPLRAWLPATGPVEPE